MKNKQKLLIVCLLLTFVVNACKEDEFIPADMEEPKEYDGLFSRMYSMVYFNDSIPRVFIEWNEAHFPAPKKSYTTVDSVTLNDTLLDFQPDGFYRSYWTYERTPFTWKVYGKNGIPSFTHKDYEPIPSFKGYASIPDSFTLGKSNFRIPLLKMNDVTRIIATLEGSENKLKKEIIVSGVDTSVTFSAQDLSVFKHLSNYRIMVFMYRTPHTIAVEEKKFKFETYLEIIKDGVFY